MFFRNVLCNDDSNFSVQYWEWRNSQKSWSIEANYKYMQNAKPKSTVLTLLCCSFQTSWFQKNRWCHEQTTLALKSLCRMYLIFVNFPFLMAQFRYYCWQSGSIKCYIVIEWTESVVLLADMEWNAAADLIIWTRALQLFYVMRIVWYPIHSVRAPRFLIWRIATLHSSRDWVEVSVE